MAEGQGSDGEVEVNGQEEYDGEATRTSQQSPQSLTEDKEELNLKKDWQEIKVADVPQEQPDETLDSPQASPDFREGFSTPDDSAANRTDTPTSSGPPPLPEKDHPPHKQPPRESIGALPSLPVTNGTSLHTRQESDANYAQSPSTPKLPVQPISSIVFVVTALEKIADSREAKRRKPLGESVQRALAAVKDKNSSPDPEIIFEPLHLATDNTSVPLTTTALDCIGKLISYSYFSVPQPSLDPNTPPSQQPQSLLDRAIDTICDCFQDEATPAETQLQILGSLLAAVLNDKVIVHGQGLLKAVRQVYNIFLISKSSTNQQIAQGALTQMVGTVFERVGQRLSMKEARMNLAPIDSEKGTANTSQYELNSSNPTLGSLDGESGEQDGSSEGVSIRTVDQPAPKSDEGEKLTLQNIETAKSFDDRRIADNAPTMITPMKNAQKKPPTDAGMSTNGIDGSIESTVEDEEDEIFVKDAFLVFRSMCKISQKELPTEQQQYVASFNMRQKLVSLAIIRTLLNNHMVVFTSPNCTIRGGANENPTSFGQAINQHLRLSISRNAASSVKQVFEIVAETFWLTLKDMRVMLKREIELFLKEIYLAILERKNAPSFQKLYVMKLLKRLSTDPRALVEIYLNYDCESTALDNMFQRIIEHLSKISSTPALVTAQVYHQYIDHYSKEIDVDIDWRDRGKIPPSLTIAHLSATSPPEWDLPTDFLLKQQALDCLVRTLRALVNWSQDNLDAAVLKPDSVYLRQSMEQVKLSIDRSQGPGSPRISSAGGDTPLPPSTPRLEDDPSQFEKQKLRKTALLNGIRQFNFKPKRGVKTLLSDGFIQSDSPEDIASFISQTEMLDKAMIGEYLGEGEPENVAIMHAFVDAMEFARRRFVDALRIFLQSFRLPGEAQKIDRFMLKFAERYMAGNPNAFANADTAYVLAYSVIMLNTDQHSTKLKGKRMTVEDFIKNNRGINDNADLPDDYLVGIYNEIGENEIVLNSERETAAALGMMPQPTGGIASRVGQALLTAGRDLQREAYAHASEEMSKKAEQRLNTLIKSQRKAMRQGQPRFVPATSFKHVGPMFDVTWMSFFSGLSGQMQSAQNIEVIKLCMEGMRLAIRVSCLFDLDTPRTAFVTALSSFTNLDNLSEMMTKNFEALKILLEVALTEGDLLKSSWRPILTCVSQLDRFQLISGGVDEGTVPDVNRLRIERTPSNQSRKSVASSRSRPAPSSTPSQYDQSLAKESRSSDMVKIIDRIFTSTAELSGEAIVYFVRALSEVSWQEIQSSGQSEAPRMYSLQKLVEISYYNMTRVRFEWSNIWQVLGEHFNAVGCHSNTHVVFFALDSLRQLSMRFMELEELPGFKFQKDFLKPFEHVMANSSTVTVKDMVLRCLIQMIQARGANIRSGWKTMFGVFTVAAREPYEAVVNLAYDHVNQVYNTRFGVVITQGAFADLVVCLTEFSKNLRFQKKSLAAIETLRSTVPRMLRTPECPLSHRAGSVPNGVDPENSGVPKAISRQTQEEQFWFPVLFAFHDILMTGDDLEVRSQASTYLFDILKEYGGGFPPEFWDILWRQLLYPIFMVLKSKSEMTKVLNHEDMSVWLSTTMIQALRNMITLFTHYFDALEYMLDRFLDLLALCICQENDTIARIGSNCLQQLILQNVPRFTPHHWHKIVGSFVELFERTTAHRLFQAATSSSDNSQIGGEDELARKGSQAEPANFKDLAMATPSDETAPLEETPTPRTSTIDGALFTNHNRSESTHTQSSPVQTPNLEDYGRQVNLQQQPVVVTAARRKYFNKIITQCVLQLLMIETVNELFSNDSVYAKIPSNELLRLMALLKGSYHFAKKFNNNRELRMRLWREGFMKQPPNLLKQESGSAACYISILFRMYHDEGEERRRSRAETEAALIPLCADIVRSFTILDESQPRNIDAWRPVVVDVLEGYTNFSRDDFEKHIDTFYPLAVDVLNKENGIEVRMALQALLRRIGECRFGMAPAEPSQTPTSPRSVSSSYFMTRRNSVVGKGR